MTRKTITVSAQWALEGKRPDGAGYRVLACSTGDLDRSSFADALSRFQLGELSDLPQVSMSYARFGTEPSLSYLALAIHWYVTEGQRYADGVGPRDSQGRLTAYTSYFCLPYKPLADAGVSYRAMFDALRSITLTAADGPPREVEVALPTSRTPAADDMAMRVAPLLLTGQPVCVVGAEGTSMLERLEFIDTVMGLLPYGFRARMTAATWTKASNRSHRFRLFFSSVPSTAEPAHVVTWGDPGRIVIKDEDASVYLDWLQDNIGSLAWLARLTSEMGFGKKHTLQALESVLGTRRRFPFNPGALFTWGGTDRPPAGAGRPADAADRPAAPANRQAALPAAAGRQPSSAPPLPASATAPPAVSGAAGAPAAASPAQALQDDRGAQSLFACYEHLRFGNHGKLRGESVILGQIAKAGTVEEQRARYQRIIADYGLLRQSTLIDDRYQDKLYDAILRVAFEVPIGYRAYCDVERCAGVNPGDAPHSALLSAILKVGASAMVTTMLLWHLRNTDEKKLNKWLASGELDIVDLIGTLALTWEFPEHARIACDVTLEYLRKAPRSYTPGQIHGALLKNGFLAHVLRERHPGNDQYQVHTMYQLLKAAYPQAATPAGQDLSPAAITEILDGGGPPPTPALLSAVLLLLEKPESFRLAWDAYIRGSTRLNLNQPTLARLQDRLPVPGAGTLGAATDSGS